MKLLQKYEEAANDPELVAQRNALLIVHKRIQDLLERVDTKESAERWKKVIEGWADYKDKRGTAFERNAYQLLDELLMGAYHDYESWRQIFEALELNRKISESERKRLQEMQQIITAEDAAKLISSLQLAIIRIFNDQPDKLKLVEHEFIRISGIGAVPQPKRSIPESKIIDPGGLDSVKLLDS